MKARNFLSSVVLGTLLFASSAFAALPWGSTAPLEVSGATPTCTYTATALSCIEDMTANVTSITLAGMTANKYYTIILMQDGTGSRTLAQTAITGAPALSTAESAANGYAVWIIQATSASAATFVADYDNAPIFSDFTASQTTAGTAVANISSQVQSSIVVPGMAAADACVATLQAAAGSFAAGDYLSCVGGTNFVNVIVNNPTAATNTPTATAVNIRLIK